MGGTIHVDGIILGAGIAGLSCADALQQNGRNCVVIDPKTPGYGASGSPGMLVNPATGRRARKAWKAEECFERISDLLERVQAETDHVFYENNGVIRPALTKKLADDFERSPEKYDWPDGWIDWLSPDEFSEQFPLLENHFGGLFVKKGMTVDGSLFVKAFVDYLENRNIEMALGREYSLRQDGKQWIAEINNGSIYKTDVVIDASGYHQTTSENWDFLPLHPIKGQTATFFFDEPLPFKTSVSSMGYMAFLKSQPNQITVGSTYEHHFNHVNTDENGLNYLRKKAENIFPGLIEKSVAFEQWSGVRVSVQDKKPVIGPHPEKEGLYIIGALGSKGLLMGRYIAELLIENIFSNVPIDKNLHRNRFKNS